jgi:hypothetical protein
MKRIIDGKSYNTDTATLVFSEGAPEPSMAWWALYQTRHGAFFKVLVDHDGETTTSTPLSDADAQALLEKRANHLVEQYFGPFPEGGAAERRLTIRIPGNLADRVEAAAKEKGLSLNSYAMRCFEKFEKYAEAADASKGIELALSTLDKQRRMPDPWESSCLAHAIGAFFRGAYRLALVEASKALTPIDQRGDNGYASDGKVFSLSELRKAFVSVQAEPVRPFPQFGPIVFAGAKE